MKKIVLATTNKGKIAELKSFLSNFCKNYGFEVIGLDEVVGLGEIEENGNSFEENALIKARVVAKYTGFISIADDSGLMVDALNGAPSIYSARYADDIEKLPNESKDASCIRKLLMQMKGINNRKAHFVCAMAIVSSNGQELTVRGEWQGEILDYPRGNNGFGYDPVFLDKSTGKSVAELSRQEKSLKSHRAKALEKLLKQLPDFIGSIKKVSNIKTFVF